MSRQEWVGREEKRHKDSASIREYLEISEKEEESTRETEIDWIVKKWGECDLREGKTVIQGWGTNLLDKTLLRG